MHTRISLHTGRFLALCLAGTVMVARAADPEPTPQRTPAGKNLSPAGVLLRREPGSKTWKPAAAKEELSSGDVLLVLPGGQAEVTGKSGAVRLSLRGNLPELSPIPVLESAVSLLPEKEGFDLGFVLHRGRVVLTNQKAKGAARVRLLIEQEPVEITLNAPGDEVGLELYGRMPQGVSFSVKPVKAERPTLDLSVHVLKGTADVRAEGRLTGMQAPPGPAFLHWDSVAGFDSGPSKRDKAPEWANAPDTPESRRVRKTLDLVAERVKTESLPDVLADLLKSARRLPDAKAAQALTAQMVLSLGAIDEVGKLADALSDTTNATARATAVEALRSWIGRSPTARHELYDAFVTQKKFTPRHAETVLQLLHSPFDPDVPETYEVLIAYLRHEQLAVRELAWWHLVRLAPVNKDIPYDAAGDAREREKAYQEWKKRIPDGKLPAKPKKEAPK